MSHLGHHLYLQAVCVREASQEQASGICSYFISNFAVSQMTKLLLANNHDHLVHMLSLLTNSCNHQEGI